MDNANRFLDDRCSGRILSGKMYIVSVSLPQNYRQDNALWGYAKLANLYLKLQLLLIIFLCDAELGRG